MAPEIDLAEVLKLLISRNALSREYAFRFGAADDVRSADGWWAVNKASRIVIGLTEMGIDPFDIVLRIEKTFGIELSTEEGIYLYDTAGWLHQMICKKLDGIQPDIPDVFAIQGKILSWMKVQPGYRWFRVTFGGRIDSIVPDAKLERAWRDLAEHLGCTLPPLQVDNGGRVRLPHRYANITDLTRWCVRNCPQVVPPKRKGFTGAPLASRAQWTDSEVWQALRNILAEILHASPDEVTPEARLVEDLGMD